MEGVATGKVPPDIKKGYIPIAQHFAKFHSNLCSNKEKKI